MLNQELQKDAAASASSISAVWADADRARVTTEEFVAAINRIEARRAQQAEQTAGTVVVGQTLHDLHINASAEEVLREIEQMRQESVPIAESKLINTEADQSAIIAKQAKRARRRRIAFSAMGSFGFFVLGGLLQFTTDRHNSPEAASLESLATLHNGQEAFVTTQGLQKIIANGSGTGLSLLVGSEASSGDYNWPVVNKDGKLYVYAYTDASGPQGASKMLHLYNVSGQYSASPTVSAIPLAGTSVVSAGNSEITLANVSPEK